VTLLSPVQIAGIYLLGVLTWQLVLIVVSTVQYAKRHPTQRKYVYAAAGLLALVAVVLYLAAVGVASIVRG